MTCAFCRERAVVACTFAISDARIFHPPEVNLHDFMQCPRDLQFYLVEGIEPGHENYRFTFYAPEGRAPHYVMNSRLPLLLMVVEPCGRPLCETCAADLGDDRHYLCPEHWAQREPPGFDSQTTKVYSVD